ncbi:MAG: sigma 54-interacting transcriptional regulator [Deltaproteobacteria bacterium]|nr:sigma 54-interacting transcriptional regulator [Deltaproteobacteria bacterium]
MGTPMDNGNMSTKTSQDSPLLALAALFDGDFSIDWIQEISNSTATPLLTAFEDAIGEGVLTSIEAGIYRFVDVGKREKLKASFQPLEKERLHRKIASLLMRDAPDEQTGTLQAAGHLLYIPNDIQGCRQLLKAGTHYMKSPRLIEAQRCFTKIIDDLGRLAGAEADLVYVQTAIESSKTYIAGGDYLGPDTVLREALGRAKNLSDTLYQAHIEMHLSHVEGARARYGLSAGHYKRACLLARDISNSKWERSFAMYKMTNLHGSGRYKEALLGHEQYVPDVARYPRTFYSTGTAIMFGECLAATGQVSQGLGLLHALRTHCRKLNNPNMACETTIALGTALLNIRKSHEAIGYLNESLKDAIAGENHRMKIITTLMLAYGHYLNSDNKKSFGFLKQFIQLLKKSRTNARANPCLLEILYAMKTGKFPRIDDLTLAKEIKEFIKVPNAHFKGIAFRYKALLQMREGAPADAISGSLGHALRWLEVSGHQYEVARTRLEIARFYRTRGNKKKADSALKKVTEHLSHTDVDLVPQDLRALVKDVRDEKDLLKEILKLGQEIVSIHDHKALVHLIISTVNRITGAERGAIFLFGDGETPSRLSLRASKNLTADEINSPGFSASMDWVAATAATGKGCVKVMTPDAHADIYLDRQVQTCICVPMVVRNKTVGILYHDNCLLPNTFRESDLEILSYFAAQAALAIDNARSYEEVQSMNQRLAEEKDYFEEQHLDSIHFENFVGESNAIRSVLSQVDQVAETNTTVLILGETGVGKELIARAIHSHSLRRDKPFIRVHACALPESLIASELFGHEKGAFTGADKQQVGRFELADTGTLFLDEIGELPLDIQVHLLRVLQTGEFERVGGHKTLHSDFRLILATNRDLQKAVRQKRFRDDLFYRINVFPIPVPPLRDRKEDIPLLVSFFISEYAAKMGKAAVKIRRMDLQRLMAYDWPGNVRELENVIERGIILSPGSELIIPELEPDKPPTKLSGPFPTLRENERRLIISALQKTNGKLQGPGGASELLDINTSTLKSRMKRLGINRQT